MDDFLRDETGKRSSTRLIGVLSGLTLCAMGLAAAFSPLVVTVDEALAKALEVVCVGCLLSSQVGKFAAKPAKGGEAE